MRYCSMWQRGDLKVMKEREIFLFFCSLTFAIYFTWKRLKKSKRDFFIVCLWGRNKCVWRNRKVWKKLIFSSDLFLIDIKLYNIFLVCLFKTFLLSFMRKNFRAQSCSFFNTKFSSLPRAQLINNPKETLVLRCNIHKLPFTVCAT